MGVIGSKRLVDSRLGDRLVNLDHRRIKQPAITCIARHPTSIFDPNPKRESERPSTAITDPRS